MLQRLPFEDPDRLAMVWEHSPTGDRTNVVNPFNFLEWRDRNHSFERIAALVEDGASLTGDGEPEQIDRLIVTDGFFEILGVEAAPGPLVHVRRRTSPTPKPVVILSAELWHRRYGGDPRILGRKIQLDQTPRTVVGVMPAGIRFPKTRADIWQPSGTCASHANAQSGRPLSSPPWPACAPAPRSRTRTPTWMCIASHAAGSTRTATANGARP